MPKKPSGEEGLKPVKFQGIVVPLYSYKDGRVAYADHATGKRKMRPFKDEETARNAAEQYAIKLLNGDVVRNNFKAADLVELAHVKQLLQPLGTALSLAVEEYVAARHICGGRPLLEVLDAGKERLKYPTKPAAEVVAEFLKIKKAEKIDPHYYDQLESLLTRFAKAVPGPIAGATTQQIHNWQLELKDPRTDELVGYKRRLAARAAVVSLFFFARDIQHYLPKDERTAAELVPVVGKDKSGICLWVPDEMRFWLNAVRREYLPWLVTTSFSGVRTEEVCPKPKSEKDRLQWTDFNWKRHYIVVRPEVSKTGFKRLVPILPNLEAWLEPWKTATGPVMPLSLQVRYETTHLNRVSKKLDKEMKAGKAIHPFPGLRWRQNANRHSYGSYRNAIIQNMPQLAEEMGNSVSVIKKDYHEAQDNFIAAEYFDIRPQTEGNIIQLGLAMGQ